MCMVCTCYLCDNCFVVTIDFHDRLVAIRICSFITYVTTQSKEGKQSGEGYGAEEFNT
jgi:hypothetical protein